MIIIVIDLSPSPSYQVLVIFVVVLFKKPLPQTKINHAVILSDSQTIADATERILQHGFTNCDTNCTLFAGVMLKLYTSSFSASDARLFSLSGTVCICICLCAHAQSGQRGFAVVWLSLATKGCQGSLTCLSKPKTCGRFHGSRCNSLSA